MVIGSVSEEPPLAVTDSSVVGKAVAVPLAFTGIPARPAARLRFIPVRRRKNQLTRTLDRARLDQNPAPANQRN